MNSAQICFKCLGPIKDCRTEDPETCWKQIAWNLKCKHCNSTQHHSLICPTNPTPSHHTDSQYDDPRGGGEGGQGDQAGRGQGRGGHQYNDNWQSNQYDNNTHFPEPDPDPNNDCADLTGSYVTSIFSKFKAIAFINHQNLIKTLSCEVIDISDSELSRSNSSEVIPSSVHNASPSNLSSCAPTRSLATNL